MSYRKSPKRIGVAYTDEEKRFIKKLKSQWISNKAIAKACNDSFHNGALVRTEGSIMQLDYKEKRKYFNKKTTVDGQTFDSKKEAEHYLVLKNDLANGKIRGFKTQVPYVLQERFKKNGVTYQAITYKADFVVEHNDGKTEVIDTKGFETEVFKIKRKLFEHCYPDLTLKVI